MTETTDKLLIHKALIAIMREVKAIGKDGYNKSQSFNYRGVDAIMNHLHPLFAKHGVLVMPTVLEERSEDRIAKSGGNLIYRILRTEWRFIAEDGSVASCTNVSEAMDSGDKAVNKALAVGLKYALTQMLLLPYDEVDPDASTPEQSTPQQSTKVDMHKEMKEDMYKEAKSTDVNYIEDDKLKAVGKVTANTFSTTIILSKLQKKSGKTKGKKWLRFYAQTEDGVYYSTFDTKIADAMEVLAGESVRLLYKLEKTPKGDLRTVIDIQPVDKKASQEQDVRMNADARPRPAEDGGEDDNLPF